MAKKLKLFSELLLGIASILTLSFAAAISPAHACEGDESGLTNCSEEVKDSVLDEDEDEVELEDDTYAEASSKLETSHYVNHSLFLAGNQISSEDYVDGIHFVAGNLIEFTGSAEYGAFAGNSLKLNGTIDKDLFAAGSAIELGEDMSIGRDLYAAATTIIIRANLNGNAFVGGTRLVLENVTIDGDLNASFDEIVIKGKSSISGTFKYNDNAKITGLDDLSTGDTVVYTGTKKSVSIANTIKVKIIFFLGKLLVIIIFVGIAKKLSSRLLNEFEAKKSWIALAIGLGLLIGVPLAALFLLPTLIGLPLGVIGLGFYALFIYISSPVAGGVLGDIIAKKVLKKEELHIFLKYAMGTIIIELLTLIPVVGGLFGALSFCFGFGYLVRAIFKKEAPVVKKASKL